ncbi:hypothetical protein QWY81_13410 [Polaribacter undariae]|uniref:DUF748 domain-containing protein n=1 Tax=Polaribacter sejongensis TaxID=985043 RepID=A0AAJ1VHM1_9FLAO|nr:hypothetical protein [Polaribacter undariae]MDN3620459.1 hypothetical protein [Polaribacter undariae]UWD33327.1 hypothetical protein NQP51_06510 [Polaribacter undariae]
MNKNKTFKILLVVISILVVYKIVDYYVTDKVDAYLKTQPLSYDAVSVNLLLGNITLKNVTSVKDSLQFTTEKLEIEDVSYYQYLKNKSVSVGNLKILNSKITGKLISKETKKEDNTSQSSKAPLDLKIDNIQFENIEIDIIKNDNFPLTVQNISFEMNGFELDDTQNKTIPFLYDHIEVSISNFETQFSKVQKVKFSKLNFEKDNLTLDSLEILPLKSREEYIYHVSQEKELMTLFSEKVVISDIIIEEKEKLHVSVNHVLFDEVFFNLYLDGTVLEHPNIRKDLYSKSLRDLPFNIDVKNVDIKNSKIVYEEYIIENNKPGILIFDKLQAQISNINNSSDKATKLTTAKIQSNFMEHCPLDIEWTFDINNKNDNFRITGSLFDVNSKNMSSFLLPTMNVKMDGYIDKMYFDFEGNDFASNGKLNLDFKNFNIKVLEKDKTKNKVLSWLANLFIKDSSKNGIVKVETENVERDTTKSFWNFFWINVQKGLQNSLI